MRVDYRFGSWLPEQVDYKNPGLEECKNVIPSPSGYKPIPAAVGTGATISGAILGARSFGRVDGTPVDVVVTTSDIYVIVSSTSNASSLSLSLAEGEPASIEQFGTKIYATVKEGGTWVLDNIETDLSFAAASGSPPSGRAMGRVDDFLVMGNLEDIDSSLYPYRLRWSQFNNPDGTWVTDIATQAGFVDLNSALGPITAISGGTFGLVFQRSGISRIDYNGSASVFDLVSYEKNRGCVSPRSVARVGDRVFFLADDGFFETDGASTRPISRGRVWSWFLDEATGSYLPEVQAAIDFESRCVVWAFAAGDSSAFTKQIWYNWETDQWSHVDVPTEHLMGRNKAGLTLEEVAVIYPNLDTMDVSLDSPAFQASGPVLATFSGDELSLLTGDNLEATLETGDAQPITGYRTFVKEVTPLIENANSATQVTLGCRVTQAETVTYTAAGSIGPLGYVPFNTDSRYIRTRITIPSGEVWDNAYGFQVEYKKGGVR